MMNLSFVCVSSSTFLILTDSYWPDRVRTLVANSKSVAYKTFKLPILEVPRRVNARDHVFITFQCEKSVSVPEIPLPPVLTISPSCGKFVPRAVDDTSTGNLSNHARVCIKAADKIRCQEQAGGSSPVAEEARSGMSDLKKREVHSKKNTYQFYHRLASLYSHSQVLQLFALWAAAQGRSFSSTGDEQVSAMLRLEQCQHELFTHPRDYVLAAPSSPSSCSNEQANQEDHIHRNPRYLYVCPGQDMRSNQGTSNSFVAYRVIHPNCISGHSRCYVHGHRWLAST